MCILKGIAVCDQLIERIHILITLHHAHGRTVTGQGVVGHTNDSYVLCADLVRLELDAASYVYEVTNDDINAGLTNHSKTLGECFRLACTLNYYVSAAAAGEFFYSLNALVLGGISSTHNHVSAKGLSDIQTELGSIGHDDLVSTQHTCFDQVHDT